MDKLSKIVRFVDATDKDPLFNDYYKKTYILHKIVKKPEYRHSYHRECIGFNSLDELKAAIGSLGRNNVYDVSFDFEPNYFLDKDGGFEAPKLSLSHNLIKNKTEVSIPVIGKKYEEHPLNRVLNSKKLKHTKMRFEKEQRLRLLLNYYAYMASLNFDEKQTRLKNFDPKISAKEYFEIKYKGKIVVSEMDKLLN